MSITNWREDDTILALDIATTMGFCEGTLRGPLNFGAVQLAPEGSSDGAVAFGLLKWLGTRLSGWKPRLIAYEAPLNAAMMKGRTTQRTLRRLYGLPMVVEGVAYGCGVYDLREIDVQDIRRHFIGKNMAGEKAKPLIAAKMAALGHKANSYDASDAIAVHRYMAAIIDPALRIEAMKFLKGTL